MAALAAQRGTPILAVDPRRAKQNLESLPWVRSAAIERRLPGTLFVRLVERQPLAVWQHAGKQELIDREGAVIPVKDLARFARLPTVVGDDAASHAAALIDMLAREPDLAARVTAAVRVDDRRWNLRIDNAIDVLLPEDGPRPRPGRGWRARTGKQPVAARRPRPSICGCPIGWCCAPPARRRLKAAPAKKTHPPGKST